LLGFVLRKDIAQTAASVGLVSQLDTWVKEVQVIPNATTNFDHRFEARIGYTAGVDVVASSALWSVTAFAHATEDSSAVDFDVLGETIPAGFYTGGDYAVSLSHLYNNPIVTVSYERNNAFFTGHADTVNGLVTSAIGSRLSVSANASGTRAKFRDQTIDVAVVNASVAVTPVDHLYLQGLVGYNSFTETALGIGSVIWQWSSRSRAALQVDHQPRLDMTSETQAFVKVVKDFSL